MKTIRWLLLVVAALAAIPAQARFHLWRMTELYSNADGTVQFLELFCEFSGEEFLFNHGLTASKGDVMRTYTFPDDLHGDTAGKSMIIGTVGFAALGVLRPDFVVPNGFFFTDGGYINFADADEWTYTALPLDGSLSLYRDGTPRVNSPRNFAGATVVLAAAAPPAPPALNFQALWWKASESGWGLNITHQGDTLFATWFTYDTDGSGMWLVVSDAHRTANNTYVGALYRTTGPAFSAVPFSPGQVAVTPAGTATFTFTDADNGTFAYSVGAVAQSKAITRQVYSTPVSNCAASTMPGSRQSYQDLWWRAPAGSESGWGLNVTHQGDILFATWFTYDAAGRGMWLVIPDARLTVAGTYAGPIYRTTGPAFSAAPWNPSQVTVTPAGTATLTFADGNAGSFAYTLDGVTQSKAIMRQAYSSPATVCH